MKTTLTTLKHLGFGLITIVLFLAAAGCSKTKPDAVALKGTWQAQENGKPAGSLVLADGNLEYHGADPREWYKATYTLHEDTNPKQMIIMINDCPFTNYVGKTANAIYRIENGVLTIAGCEPGNPAMPTGFGGPGVRLMSFKMQ